MTLSEAGKVLHKKFPRRDIMSAYNYDGGILFIAPDKNSGGLNDFDDPYFVVYPDKKIRKVIPTADLQGFMKVVNGPALYKKE